MYLLAREWRLVYLRGLMRRLIASLLIASACGRNPEVPQALVDAGITAAPGVVTQPAAVLFWLEDVDTLQADSAVTAVHDLTGQARELVELLSDSDVAVYFTTASRIYVRAADSPRRIVSLRGLDYPWGVVLVEPGYAEQVITGPVAPADLHDLVHDYFGFEEDRVQGPIASDDWSIQRFGDWVERVGSRSLVHGITDYTDASRLLRPTATIVARKESRLCFVGLITEFRAVGMGSGAPPIVHTGLVLDP